MATLSDGQVLQLPNSEKILPRVEEQDVMMSESTPFIVDLCASV